MTSSKKVPGANISQSDRFAEAARDVGASEDAADFDLVLGKIAKAPPTDGANERKRQKQETKKPAK